MFPGNKTDLGRRATRPKSPFDDAAVRQPKDLCDSMPMKTSTTVMWKRPLAASLALLLGGTLFVGPAAAAREGMGLATPFEVTDSPAGNYLSALVAGADHDTTAAATFFREALRFDPRNPQLIERAFVAALSNGNMLDSFTLADRLVARDPNNGLAHLALGVKALKSKQYPWARTQLSRGGPSQQRDVTATLLTAWSYAGSGDEKKAIEICTRLNDDTFAVFRDFHAGLIAQLLGDKAEAGKRLKAAYEADKGTLRLVDAYGRYLSISGDRDGALKVYQDFNAILPNHPLVNTAIGELKDGKTLEPLIKNADQGASEVLYGLGSAGNRQGDEIAAMVYLRLSLYLYPRNSLALITLADIYDRLKQNEQAIGVYQGVPETSPLRTTADIQIAQLLDNLGKKTESAKYLEDVVSAHPDDQDALLALGNSERGDKKFAEAADTYTRALSAKKPASSQVSGTTMTPPTDAAHKAFDVSAYLDGIKIPGAKHLDWRHSTTDLLRLMNKDTSPDGRRKLAKELDYSGDGSSASINAWLRKRLIEKLQQDQAAKDGTTKDETAKDETATKDQADKDQATKDQPGATAQPAAVKGADRTTWALYYFRGISYEREKQWDKAVADFRTALKLFPEQPLVLNYLGYSWVDRGENLDEAFKMLHKAVELRPSDGYIVDSLGWAYYKLGKYDQAVKELERAIDLKPGDPTVNDHLGDAYWRVGRKLEAHFQWNHARDLGPEPDDKKKILEKIAHGLPAEKAPEAADAKDKAQPAEPATKKDGG